MTFKFDVLLRVGFVLSFLVVCASVENPYFNFHFCRVEFTHNSICSNVIMGIASEVNNHLHVLVMQWLTSSLGAVLVVKIKPLFSGKNVY